MALEFIAQYTPGLVYRFDREYGGYHASVEFKTKGAGSAEQIMEKRPSGVFDETVSYSTPVAAMPFQLEIWHPAFDLWGTETRPHVWCYLSGMTVTRTTTAGVYEIEATYDGRIRGVHRTGVRTQMVNEMLMNSLADDPPGSNEYKGIGVDFSGTTRDIPCMVYSAEECVAMANLDAVMAATYLTAGSVNEDGWNPPWYSTFEYGEGALLYLGVTGCSVDRASLTAMIVHEFAQLTDRNRQDVYEWYLFTKGDRNIAGYETRTYEGAAQQAAVQYVAGTNGYGTFADLGLDKVIL